VTEEHTSIHEDPNKDSEVIATSPGVESQTSSLSSSWSICRNRPEHQDGKVEHESAANGAPLQRTENQPTGNCGENDGRAGGPAEQQESFFAGVNWDVLREVVRDYARRGFSGI
jgi:hypothetical protein